jgi:plasmid stability protein
MAREDLHFRLRIPEDLKAKVEVAAAENHRSMTAEIVARLYGSFDPEAISQEFADHIQALHHSEEMRGMQAKYVEALSRENEALRKAGINAEQIIFTLARAVTKAAEGDRTELEQVIEREKEQPILDRLMTVSSIVGEK